MNSHLDLYSNPMPYGSEPLSCGHAQLSDSQGHAHLLNKQSYPHLSDNQIDDYLIGDLAAGAAAHLAACPICTERVATAASPLASFQSVTMAWSERCSATLPIPDLTRQQPFWQRHMTWATACFIFAIGIALTSAGHRAIIGTAGLLPMQQDSTQQASVEQDSTQQDSTQQDLARQAAPPSAALTETASVTVTPQEAQIFADNQLLKAIDDDLDTSADSPAALGIEPGSAQPRGSSTTLSVQD